MPPSELNVRRMDRLMMMDREDWAFDSSTEEVQQQQQQQQEPDYAREEEEEDDRVRYQEQLKILKGRVSHLLDDHCKFKDSPVLRVDWQIRFLDARDGNPEAAYDMMETALTWRHERDVDDILNIYPAVGGRNNELMKWWPVCWHGRCKRGVPIKWERAASINLKEMWERWDEDDLIMFHMYSMEGSVELMHQTSQCMDKTVTRYVVIQDLTDISWSLIQNRAIKLVKAIFAMDQEYYPGGLKHMYVVNCNWLVRFLISMLTPFVSASTMARVTFVSSGESVADAMAEHVNPSQIPRSLGGKCRCEICWEGQGKK